MQPPSRPPNRRDGTAAVTTRGESGGEPAPVGAAGASAQTSRSSGHPGSAAGGEPESPARCRSKATLPPDSTGALQKRSRYSSPRRSSSGYFSFDGESLPSSPLSPRPVMVDRATQTPSPTGQAIMHALRRGAPGTQQLHGSSPSPSSTRQRSAASDMQAEEAVGQELRRIGDDFNRLLLRGGPFIHGQVVIHPNQLPHIHQEPTVLLCMGLLLLLIGRIIYLQGSTNSQDHSQV